jgi:N-acetyl sugar amidotransferase
LRYCARCLYPENHPLGLVFDAEGVCSGCRVHEEKYTLDWESRRQRLGEIFDLYRSRSGRTYDCIVPVSGARDSYFIVHTVKRVFGMNPLLVSYNRQYNTERGIRNLAYLRTTFDCDYLQQVISPDRIKRNSRATIRRLGSMHWHVLAGQTVWPVQVAVRLKVPLIVWGAHQGLDQVGMFSHTDEVQMTRKYRVEHDLMGVEAEDLIGGEENLRDFDLRPFAYPHDLELSKVGVRGVYLGNYIPWDSKRQHEDMHALYDQEWAVQQRTFDTYNDVDCQHYSGLHDWIKFLKWGYGKATDHACREIRLKRMTREEGVALANRYRDVVPQDKMRYLQWVGMEEIEFDACIDAHRDPRIWEKAERGWRLRDSVSNHVAGPAIEAARLQRREDCEFGMTPSKDSSADESRYVLMARGYMPSHPAVNRRGGNDRIAGHA